MEELAIEVAVIAGVIAAIFDVRTRRIPNWITYPVILVGLGLGAVESRQAAMASLLGFVAAGGFFFLLWLTRCMGVGDMKLMAAMGALCRWPFILSVTFFVALAGGMLGFLYLIWAPRKDKDSTAEAGARRGKLQVPYAVAIAAGAIVAVAMRFL